MLQVGRRLVVQITRLNEDKNDLILSEKTAWVGFLVLCLCIVIRINDGTNDISDNASGEGVP